MSDYPTLVSMNENVVSSSGAPLFFPAAPQSAQPPAPSEVPEQAPAASQDPAPETSCDPGRGPTSIELDPAVVQAMSEVELQQQIQQMLACLRRRTLQEVAAGDMYSDGTLAVDSMTAVWVITTFGKAFRRRLVRLSDVDPDSLRSVGSVAKLIKQTTASLMAAGAA